MGWLKSLLVGVIVDLIKQAWAAFYKWVTEWQRKQKRQNEQNQAASEFEKVVENPNSDLEERMKSHADAVNSGRKP